MKAEDNTAPILYMGMLFWSNSRSAISENNDT